MTELVRPRRLFALAGLVLLVLCGPAHAATRAPYEVKPARYRADPKFTVRYEGSGWWRTAYRATPPNPGHKPDHNAAHDSSTQAWKLRYRGAVTIPACGPPAAGGDDPCLTLSGPTRATGSTLLTGKIDHSHVDGVYRVLDRTVKCRLRKRTARRQVHSTTVGLRYDAAGQTIGLRASGPVSTALSLFPTVCPRQGDSIDRIADNYFTPGFSFDPAYGPDRWFTSREIAIPVDVFHRSREIRVRLADTRSGTPPLHCAVRSRATEHCTTRGSWSGVLTFELKP
jgi:hypothetical protein